MVAPQPSKLVAPVRCRYFAPVSFDRDTKSPRIAFAVARRASAARKAQAARLLINYMVGQRTNTGPSIQRLAQPHEAGIGINIVYFCIKNSDDFKGASFVKGDSGLWLGILRIRFCVRYICREVSSNRADGRVEPWFRYNARSESRAVSVA